MAHHNADDYISSNEASHVQRRSLDYHNISKIVKYITMSYNNQDQKRL